MKRGLLLILAAIVLLATVFMFIPSALSPSPASASVNLILNSGFEEPTGDGNQPPSNWGYSTSSPFRGVPPDVHSGNYSAYLHGASGYYSQTVSIATNTIYWFQAYTRANASGNETVTLTIRNSSGTVLDTHSWTGTDHGWALRTGYLTTPVNAWDAVVTLSISGDSGAEAWFDDIVLEEKTPSGGGCFIATAAYGTETAEQLDVLRAFRDQVLLQSPIGSQFVKWYYKTSPPIADFISEHSILRAVVREALIDPMVSLAKLSQGLWGD
jgi:hypothetical protein